MPTPTKAALLLALLVTPAYAAPVQLEQHLNLPALTVDVTPTVSAYTFDGAAGPFTGEFTVTALAAHLVVNGVAVDCPLRRATLEEERGTIAHRDPDGRDSTSWRARSWRVICTVGSETRAGILSIRRTVHVSHRKEILP